MLDGIRIITLAALSSFSTLSAQNIIDGKYYPNPGIIGLEQNKMVGSDHLLNVSEAIPVVVEIFKPGDAKIDLTKEQIHSLVSKIFALEKISTINHSGGEGFHLPFFHVLIMLYPLPNGYAVSCQGRLFEQVELKRVQLDQETAFQAITWESQNLLITPEKELVSQVSKSIEEIAKTFTSRYAFYQGIEQGQKEGKGTEPAGTPHKKPVHREYKQSSEPEHKAPPKIRSGSGMSGGSGGSGMSGGSSY